jgi:mannose-6-phosphate isomerase-like protein (cupin superfamily)
MKNVQEYISSGILEIYVSGNATDEQCREVIEMASAYPEIHEEIAAISDALEKYAFANAIPVNPTIKPFLMAVVDYSERLKNGELPAMPAILSEASTIEDYAEWVNRKELSLPNDFEDIYVKIIGYTPQAVTAIVWIKDMAPQEVHDDQLERFLILEGSCDIHVEDEIHSLVPGNYFSIPLHKHHEVRITSSIPCKVILQRVAA